jgi:hypothetical protein
MPTKNKPANVNTNHNVNNNTNNITINVPPQEGSSDKKKSEPNWYIRTILGGIITLALSIGGYYIKKNMDEKGKGDASSSQPDIRPIETTQH